MAIMRVTMDVGNDGVAVIKIYHPPINSLHTDILSRLKEKYQEALRRNDVKAIVVTGEAGKFSGGFDISVIKEFQLTGDFEWFDTISLGTVRDTIEEAKKPSVAAIQGLALGGGLELAMACHARIATPEVKLGMPELQLGVIPGFGGTQRLPRIVGVLKAVEMMLSSKPITSEEGKDLGLIDEIVSSEQLLRVSRLRALDIAEKRSPWTLSLQRTDKISSLSEERQIIEFARQRIRKAAPNMPQYEACLDAIEDGITNGGNSGLLKEIQIVKQLGVSSTSKGLVHVFYAQRIMSKVPNVTDVGLKPCRIQKVALVGVGLMGSGIATSLILSKISVLLKEKDSTSLQRGIKVITANLQALSKRGKLTQDRMEKALSLLKGVSDYSEFKHVDMVIEAVDEDVPLKQSIFSEIEKICPPHCVLATNTSTIDLNVVGEKTSSQDRIIGAHFFSPAHVMPLLEVVRTEKTSPQAILDLMTLGRTIKKVPVVVANCTGFAVNRTFLPYNQGAGLLLMLGVNAYRIDKVIISFGMRLGPFQLQDLMGYTVALAAGEQFFSAYPHLVLELPLIELMMKNGRDGKNNGKGYYLYEKGSKPKPDPSVEPIIEECRRLTNIMPGGKPISVSDQDIVEMIFFPVVNEACRVMDEGVVVRASDLDMASILGMSFPPFRGGIVYWADSVGPHYIYTCLKKWSEAYGVFYKPSRFLEERAMKGIPLSAPTSNPRGSNPRL